MEGNWGLEEGIPARLSRTEGRRFGLVVGTAFVTLSALLLWRGHPFGSSGAALIGTLLILAGLAIPGRLRPVQAAWMGLAGALSKVTTPIFLGIVYFAVLTPAGLLIRFAGHNPLSRDRTRSTFWVSRDATLGRKSDMERQF